MAPVKIYDFDPRNLPKDTLAAIGLCVACSAQAESTLEMAIGACLGLDYEYSLTVTTHMAMPLRFDILRAAAEIRLNDLDDLDLLDNILDNLKLGSVDI